MRASRSARRFDCVEALLLKYQVLEFPPMNQQSGPNALSQEMTKTVLVVRQISQTSSIHPLQYSHYSLLSASLPFYPLEPLEGRPLRSVLEEG